MNKDRPNMLIIMSDQHNKHITGCYGDRVISTPNLDHLASQGVLFENAYSPFPLCGPSRMSFLTGKNPSSMQMYDNSSVLPSSEPTFLHALGQSGYETILCGRMDFKGTDQRHGFQKRIFPEVSGHASGMLEGTNHFGRVSLEKSGPGRNHYLLYDQECVKRATDWLKERNRDENKDPFCLVVGLVGPHSPFVCPPELFEKYFETIEIPEYSEDHFPQMSTYNQRFRERSKIDTATPHEIKRTRAAYYGMIEFDDRLVGELILTLDETNMRNDTLIIYVSDHGEMAGEHGLWWKMSFYEGSVGIPMIFSLPGVIHKGFRSSLPISLMDLAPTLTEFGLAPELQDIHGRSVFNHLHGLDEENDRSVFSELFTDRIRWKEHGPSGGPGRMLRKGKWKCNFYYGEEPELFNLDQDPEELVDCSQDPVCISILEEMLAEILEDWDPEFLQADMDQLTEKRSLLGDAHNDPPLLDGEYWLGPKDYGWVDPV
jgi:choline-sulfatase